ncbi:hypothetical protein KM792_02635 [Clostridium tyrobutyricum]|uniref:DUF6809 family protein n=1 Tax=Clostridium tyrobutyricum TaxID=1519 RepID=UPI0018A9C2CE|nr:DUF6809 family protein [Clostridium tyrobutyricum]MBV4416107.1 hypothetical protein [Clostridium tyrobutyricum]MBV4437152.1 hypothetical protein [Clostridium tyrobutyricum]MBV4448559.1 hypothetical protein [Clostridium tyrobutyricum]MEA5009408.1 hypothetical protein [Clostridium tyrobutyricum]
MDKDFEDTVKYFMERRISKILLNLKNNAEYNELKIRSRNIENKIMNKLNSEEQNLFIKYEDILDEQLGIAMGKIYKTGFEDSIKIINGIKNIKHMKL